MGRNASPGARAHLPVLDGVRGVAVALVLVSHGANAGLLPRWLGQGVGEMGVCLFFILSGFLMAYLYLDDTFGEAALSRYARHRIGRVLPLYYAVLGLSLLLPGGAVWLFPVADSLVPHLLLLKGDHVLWTIPVEVQFYLVFVSLWWARGRGLFLALLLLWGAVGALAAAVLLVAGAPAGNLAFWLQFFLFGSLVGWAFAHHGALFERLRIPALGVLAPLLLVAAFPELRRMADLPTLPTFADPLTAGAPAVFFLASLFGLGPLKALALAPMRWLGKVSYAVYLFHYPVLMSAVGLLAGVSPGEGALVFAGVVAVTLLLAALSHDLFEMPVKRLVDRAGRVPARRLRPGALR